MSRPARSSVVSISKKASSPLISPLPAAFPRGLRGSHARPVQRVGLFGGSFDPPHLGHLLIAERAHGALSLDRVVFIPCSQSPLKTDARPVSGSDRAAMLQAALRGRDWAVISGVELAFTGPSYSVRTVRWFQERLPGVALLWIMGSDQWALFDQWKDHHELAQMVEFVVYPRPHPPEPRDGVRCHFLDFRVDVSSTEIREALQNKDRRSIPLGLPPAVYRHIRRRNLYCG